MPTDFPRPEPGPAPADLIAEEPWLAEPSPRGLLQCPHRFPDGTSAWSDCSNGKYRYCRLKCKAWAKC
jgi:hypothetical protein